MKKILVLILLILIVIPVGFAQEKTKKEKKKLPTPYVEVWGGMGLFSVTGNLAAADKRLGGLFGAGFTLPISKKNNLHAELAYTFSGFKYESLFTIQEAGDTLSLKTKEQRLNYFKLNIMDKYFLDSKRMFYVNGGIYASLLVQARYQAAWEVPVEGTDDVEHVDDDIENKDFYKPYDFGLVGGVGVRLGNKRASNFIIEARVSYGLVNILEKPIDGEDYKANNIYGVIKLGVDIPVKN